MKETSGVFQRSILGPDFWNALYDNLLRLKMPNELPPVGYEYDAAARVTARTVEYAQRTLKILMRQVSRWLAEHGFSLVLENTKVVVLTKGRVPTILPIRVGEPMVLSKPAMKYLSIIIDTKMSFFEQIHNSADKDTGKMFLIWRLMSNVGGTLSNRRRLQTSAAQSFASPKYELISSVYEIYRKDEGLCEFRPPIIASRNQL